MTDQQYKEWGGGDCPENPYSQIEPAYRGPSDPKLGTRITCAPAARLDWSHDGGDDDIVGYWLLHEAKPR